MTKFERLIKAAVTNAVKAYKFNPGSYTYSTLSCVFALRDAFEDGEAYEDLGFPTWRSR